MRNVEERRAENGGAEESQEDRRGDEIIRDVLAAHVGQAFAENAEALAQFQREVSVARQYPAPRQLDGVAQVLLLLVQRGDGCDLERVHFAIATFDGASHNGTQCLLQIPVSGQFQVGFHRLRGQRVASKRESLVIWNLYR